jgi:hypothetical protein
VGEEIEQLVPLGDRDQVDGSLDSDLRLAALAIGDNHTSVGLHLWPIAKAPGREQDARLAVSVAGLAW